VGSIHWLRERYRTSAAKISKISKISYDAVLLRGVFDKERLLDLIENFIVFSEKDGQPVKMLAGYHQFYGVREAVESAKETQGDDLGRIGVYWHTQGSGKSLSMVYFVRKIRRSSDFGNPTFVVVTDRNELDEQITHTHSAMRDTT
jgi:type I restriction enzyme R subunit